VELCVTLEVTVWLGVCDTLGLGEPLRVADWLLDSDSLGVADCVWDSVLACVDVCEGVPASQGKEEERKRVVTAE